MNKKVFELAIYPYLMKRYNAMFEEIIEKYQISQIEIDVLAFLYNNPEYKKAQDIVDVRGISKAYVSIAIEKLTQKNYLIREPNPQNRRCNLLYITDEAQSLVNDILAVQGQYFAKAYEGFSKEDIVEYHRLMQKVYENLGGTNCG